GGSGRRPGPWPAAILSCLRKLMQCYIGFAPNGVVVTTDSISRPASGESLRPNFSFKRYKCETMCVKLLCNWRYPNWPTLFLLRTSISLGGATNFCAGSKRFCDVGEIAACRLCRPIQRSNASSPLPWNLKTANPGKNGAKAPAQTFIAFIVSISSEEGRAVR